MREPLRKDPRSTVPPDPAAGAGTEPAERRVEIRGPGSGVPGRGPGGGGDQGRRRGRARRGGGGPAPHLVEFILGRNPQLRVDGALQRLDDPVEVHLPRRGLRGPRTSRPDCRFSFSFDPLSLLRRDP